MTTNLLAKYLSLLIGGTMVFVLASCKDDELAPDFDEPEVNITIPTEDEVKTTVGKNYAVLGEHFDEVAETYDRTTLRPQPRRHRNG